MPWCRWPASSGMDAYATQHAVATAALIIAFGRHQGMPEPEIEKLALGTMVKDIGHAARLMPRLTSKARHSVQG